MKIGIDARQLITDTPAGVSTYLRNILRAFATLDRENEFVLYAHHDINDEHLLNERFRKRIVPGKVGTLWLRNQMPGVLVEDDVDVFWGPEHVVPKRNGRTRSVLTVHDLGLVINRRWGQWYNALIQNRYLARSVRDADAIIAISESTKRDIERYCPGSQAPISVIYNGASQGGLPADAHAHADQVLTDFGVRGPYLLYVGTIEPRKNIEGVVRAFDLVRDERDAQLVLAGKLGWRYQPILAAIDAARHKDDIIRHGYITDEERDALYARGAGFVFPSHYEGFGIPIAEAMAKGLPVVTARNSSLPEVGGEVAFYVDDENDVQALAREMRRCLDLTAKERAELVPRLQANAARFTWESCAEQTYRLIMECASA